MRSLKDLRDVEAELARLDRVIVALTTQDIDLSKRRIKNASPSKDPFDYVTRRELLQFLSETQDDNGPKASGSSGGVECCVFGLGINTSLITGEDLPPHHIVTFNATITGIYLNCKVPPSGASILGQIVKNYGGVNAAIIADFEYTGEQIVVKLDEVLITSLQEMDFLTCHLSQVGSEIAGGSLVVKIKYIPS